MAVETLDPGTRRSPTRSAKKLPTRSVCERYGVVERTIDRWIADPKLNFPKPMIVNKRRYFDEGELDAFDASKVEG
jgi:predicted DNA-binding transcriptional regulator AlpA